MYIYIYTGLEIGGFTSLNVKHFWGNYESLLANWFAIFLGHYELFLVDCESLLLIDSQRPFFRNFMHKLQMNLKSNSQFFSKDRKIANNF